MNTIRQFRQTRLFGTLAVMLGFMLAVTLNVTAVDYTWTGDGDGTLWNDSENWTATSIGYPGKGAGDVAAIQMNAGIILSENFAINQLRKNGSLDMENPAVIRIRGGGLTFNGNNPLFEVGCKLADTTVSNSRSTRMFVENTDIRIGSPAQLGRFAVTYYGTTDLKATSKGWYTQTNGSFSAYLSFLYVGNCQENKVIAPIQGTLDLRAVDNVDITVAGPLWVHGSRNVGLGELLLGNNASLIGGDRTTVTPSGNFYAGYLDGSTSVGFHGTSVFSVVSGNIDLRYDLMRFGSHEINGSGALGTLASTTIIGPATAMKLEANQLFVGAGAGNGVIVDSLFAAPGTQNGEVKVNTSFQLGSGRSTRDASMNLGTNWTFKVGTAEEPANLFAAAYYYSYYSWQTNYATLTMQGGSFEAYCTNYFGVGSYVGGNNSAINGIIALSNLTNVVIKTPTLKVGCWDWNSSTLIPSYGLIDLKSSKNIRIDADVLKVGAMANAVGNELASGAMYLGEGTAVVGDLSLAYPFSSGAKGAYGTLGLNGMQMAVTNSFVLGNRGAITSVVEGISSGIVLSGLLSTNKPVNFTTKWYGTNTIIFVEQPRLSKRDNQVVPLNTLVGATDMYWGFAWEGNHVDDIKAMWDRDGGSGKIQVVDNLTDEYANRVDVFYDAVTATTYIGFPYRETPAATRVQLF